jgi:hypothetical protein
MWMASMSIAEERILQRVHGVLAVRGPALHLRCREGGDLALDLPPKL